MAIPCEKCGAQNPADNRFCGQCGSNLQTSVAAETPEEFRHTAASGAEPLKASADLPPEVIDFDNQIPLFAGEGTDRRVHLPTAMASEVHAHLEREAELHDQLHHVSETHHDVLVREIAARTPLPPEVKRQTRTGVSGPSFLGLSEDHPSDYLLVEDEEPPSHLRRNLALTVLVAAIVLAAMQWRSVRDYSLAYIQNGSMQVKPRGKDAPQNPPAIAADNTARDLGLPASAKPGAPKSLEDSPNADRMPPQATAAQARPPQASPAQPAATAPQPAAMSSPPPDVPHNNPSAASAPSAPLPSVAQPRAARSTPGSAKNSARNTHRNPAPAALPGADEMSRAARASDSQARAVWLWRAVGKGNPQAPVELATMYERGYGVVRSCDQARILLRSAAAKGNERARIGLQQMRFNGCR